MQWSLVTGPLPWLLSGVGALCAAWLIGARRRLSAQAVAECAGLGFGAAIVIWVVVERWWRPFPDALPRSVYTWVGIAVAALALLAVRISVTPRWIRRIAAVTAAVCVITACAVQINLEFGAYPTLEDLLGTGSDNRISLTAVPAAQPNPVTGWPIESVWSPPPPTQVDGRVVRAVIPGTRSGFRARPAEIYLPPAYFTDPRPLLPVLVLLPGQPGSPVDWLNGGRVDQTMDAFAAAHGGLAPVTVIADATGGAWRNPLCLDSRLGKVASYLAIDVPAWVNGRLQVDPDPRRWAIGGMSYGGTCALQIATNYPDRYPSFLDLSGDAEPSLGDRRQTVQAAFGGDTAAFERVNPPTLLRTRRYPNSAGALVTGTEDDTTLSAQRSIAAAARAAGMTITTRELPGGHNWSVWSAGLRIEMDWLAQRLGLTR
ncbi:alpha/beta hydrolase [Nocardia thailandica]|nr:MULTISPECIES: alpha/beta hydrolase-fold protein [Nocardia]